jgi:hypothetical protein
MKIHTLACQILGVTCDNASNNDKMIEHIATLIDTFPGAANQTRCFTHILNLVAKSVLRQFEAPKLKEGDVIDDAAKQLAAIFDELEDEDDSEVSNNNDAGGDGDGNNDDVGGDGHGSDEHEDDDDDGLVDERDGMSKEELASLEESVKPIRVVLTKVQLSNSDLKITTNQRSLALRHFLCH